METSIYLVARLWLGFFFLFSGLNAFFNWRPLPKVSPEMKNFVDHLVAAQIIMPVVKVFEVLFGLLLVFNFYAFIAVLALLPICFFIVFAQIRFNRPEGMNLSVQIVFPMLIILYHHRESLEKLLIP